jgi:hypothetical protein
MENQPAFRTRPENSRRRLMSGRVGKPDQPGEQGVKIFFLFASVSGIGRAKDSGFGLLRHSRPRVAVDRAQSDTCPSHATPGASLDNPSPDAIVLLDNPRPAPLEFFRQTPGPEVEGQMHHPAMPVSGYHAKSLLHRDLLLQIGSNQLCHACTIKSLPASCIGRCRRP